jgi:hypothetical protein
MAFHRGVIRPFRPRTRPPRAVTAPGARSRAALPRVVGQIPAVALADEIEAGNVRALFVTGGNPLTAFPQPARLRAALARLDVLAIVDVMDNELTAIATHVLPATGQLERADLTLAEPTAVRGGLQATRPVVTPIGDRKPVWWMFSELCRAMQHAPEAPDLRGLTDEQYLRGVLGHTHLDAKDVFASGPRGIEVATVHGWVHDEFLHDGRWRIAPAPLLARLATYADPDPVGLVIAPRREMPSSNSVVYGAGEPTATARVHPTVADGPTITLVSGHGTLTASVVTDENIRADVVSVTHGRAAESPGELTSTTADVDDLTAMPRAAGLRVDLG